MKEGDTSWQFEHSIFTLQIVFSSAEMDSTFSRTAFSSRSYAGMMMMDQEMGFSFMHQEKRILSRLHLVEFLRFLSMRNTP